MKKIVLFLTFLILATTCCLCACDLPDDDKLQSEVSFAGSDGSVPLYYGATVKVENSRLPLYAVKVNNVHSWTPNPTDTRSDSGAGYFSLKGKARLTVEVAGMTDCVVRPLSAGVSATVENGVAKFTLKSAGNYSVEPNGDAKQAFFLFVSDAEKVFEPTTRNVIRFEKGLHTSQNSNYITNDTVVLSSDTTVVLEEGAVVRARFVANNQQNVTVCGNGIIDGSHFVRNASTGQVTVPLDFNYCTNVRFQDFSVLDPAGWCVNWYFCSDSTIDNVKIISSRSNGDGISLQSCKNVRVENCFLRTWDDSLVVKNYPQWTNKSVEGSTQNVIFSRCTLWTDLAQSMEIGYETVGETLCDVKFENITVLHNFHKPVISIHNGNNARIKNVVYDTITVEDASMGRGDAGSNSQLCEFSVAFSSNWSSQHKVTALGSVEGVTVKNLTVLGGNVVITLRVAGSLDSRDGFGQTVHRVSDVLFQNVWLNGRRLKTSDVSKNVYADFSVRDGAKPVTVDFAFSQSEETLAKYTDSAVVVVL